MSGRVHAEVKAPSDPAPSFAPVQSGLLHIKSLLGGASGLIGEFDNSRMKQSVSQPPLIQPKLIIGEPNDIYEQEADRVAEEVMRMPEPRLQRQVEPEEEEALQTKPLADQITPLVQREIESEEEKLIQTKQTSGQTHQAGSNLKAQIRFLRGSGQPLTQSTRNFFEPRFGHDFSRVRVHTSVPKTIQTKLIFGQPNDQYEREADRVADEVVSRINAPHRKTVQHQELSEGHEEHVQMKGIAQQVRSMSTQNFINGRKMAVTSSLEISIRQTKGSGQSLPNQVLGSMEQAFGADFSGVKFHTDTRSDRLNRSLNTRAFTTGKDIFFSHGAYYPESNEGQELIAHELTHVLQQRDIKTPVSNSIIQGCWIMVLEELQWAPEYFVSLDFRRRYPNYDPRMVVLQIEGDRYYAQDVSRCESWTDCNPNSIITMGPFNLPTEQRPAEQTASEPIPTEEILEPRTGRAEREEQERVVQLPERIVTVTHPTRLIRAEDSRAILDNQWSTWHRAARFGIQNSTIQSEDDSNIWFAIVLGGNLIWAIAGLFPPTALIAALCIGGAIVAAGSIAELLRTDQRLEINRFRLWAINQLNTIYQLILQSPGMIELTEDLTERFYDQGLTDRDSSPQADQRRRVAWEFFFGSDVDYVDVNTIEQQQQRRVETLWQCFNCNFPVRFYLEGLSPYDIAVIAQSILYRCLVTTGEYRTIPGVVRIFQLRESPYGYMVTEEVIRFPGGVEAIIPPGTQIPR